MTTAHSNRRGETLISMIIAMAIFSILIVAISAFELSILRSHKSYTSRAQVEQNNITFLHDFTKLLRAAQPAADSSYLIASATDTDFVFFSDLGSNGIVDRIHYFVENNTMKRGIVEPTGAPLAYDLSKEVITSYIPSISTTSGIFTYYDSTFDGTTHITPLPLPIVVSDIRTVKVQFTVNPAIATVPPTTVTTHVTIRNLKSLQ